MISDIHGICTCSTGAFTNTTTSVSVVAKALPPCKKLLGDNGLKTEWHLWDQKTAALIPEKAPFPY